MVRYYQSYNKKIQAWVKFARWPDKQLHKIVEVKKRESTKPWVGVEVR